MKAPVTVRSSTCTTPGPKTPSTSRSDGPVVVQTTPRPSTSRSDGPVVVHTTPQPSTSAPPIVNKVHRPSTTAPKIVMPFKKGAVSVTEEDDHVILHSSSEDIEIGREGWILLKASPTISRFVGDLCVAAFGIPYLRTHSLTGKKSSKAPVDQPLKPAADKSVIRAITEIAEHFYPGQAVKNSYFTIKFNNCDKKPRAAARALDLNKDKEDGQEQQQEDNDVNTGYLGVEQIDED